MLLRVNRFRLIQSRWLTEWLARLSCWVDLRRWHVVLTKTVRLLKVMLRRRLPERLLALVLPVTLIEGHALVARWRWLVHVMRWVDERVLTDQQVLDVLRSLVVARLRKQ